MISWWKGRAVPQSSELRTRARRAAPVLLLVLSLLVAGLGAVEAVRAQRSHRATAEGLLRDYGAFAAWSFAERAAEELGGSAQTTLYPPRTQFLTAKNPTPCLEEVLAEGKIDSGCGCGVRFAGRYAFLVRVAPEGAAPMFVGEGPPPDARLALADRVVEHARSEWRPSSAYAILSHGLEPDGSPSLIAYHRLANAEGDTVVYGVHVNMARVRERMDSVLAHPDLLPQTLTRGQAGGSLLAVQVLDAQGRPLFASHDGAFPALYADQPLPDRVGGGLVRAAVLPEAAGQLIIGGLPRNRLPVLLLIFALSGGLALLAASQFRKENQLVRLRSDFVASVSHELRSPLAQIRLFVETLRLGRTRDEAQRDWALERIERESMRLSSLVEKVLHFSRSERGAGRLEREPAELGVEVEDAVAAIQPLLPRSWGRFASDIPAGLGCELHRDSFRQVVVNLVENAVKYGAPGQTIRLTGLRTNGHVRLMVDDEGPGVPVRERERIFEPFCRGERAVGSVAAGSGIGLSVVRDIVRAHGGRVWAESAPGGGARFVVELPALRTPRADQLAGQAAGGSERAGAAAGAA